MKVASNRRRAGDELDAELSGVGGEPLAGSGFEDETPDPEFSDTEPAALIQQ
jgi:hypothetical protein